MKLEPIAVSTIPDAIIQQIKRQIAEGSLKPGNRLPNERELGEQCGVGRSSVREALMALSAMGVLVRRREGTFVNPDSTKLVWHTLDEANRLTRSTIHEVFEARRMFEVGVAALAAERATPEMIAEIRRWIPDTVSDVESFKLADVQFHTAIAKAAGNPFIYELYTKVQEILFQTHQYYMALENIDPRSSAVMYGHVLEQHLEIMYAIEARDPARAQGAMLDHFKALEASMLPELSDVAELPEEGLGTDSGQVAVGDDDAE